MINTNGNPVSIRSKMYLTEALLELMEEKSYESISIKELADKAQLARRTFYTNFETKDDILRYHLNTLVNEYVQILQKYESLTSKDIATEYFNYWFSHKSLICTLKKNKLPILLEVFEEFLNNMSSLLIIKNQRFNDSELEYYDAVFVSGGLWNMLNVWVDNDFKKNPEDLTNIFLKIFNNSPS